MAARVYDTGRGVCWHAGLDEIDETSSAPMTSCTWARKVGRAPPQRGPAPSHRAHRQLSSRHSFGQFDLHRGVFRRPYHATTPPPLREKKRPGGVEFLPFAPASPGAGCRGRSGGRSWGRVELKANRIPLAVVGCQPWRPPREALVDVVEGDAEDERVPSFFPRNGGACRSAKRNPRLRNSLPAAHPARGTGAEQKMRRTHSAAAQGIRRSRDASSSGK